MYLNRKQQKRNRKTSGNYKPSNKCSARLGRCPQSLNDKTTFILLQKRKPPEVTFNTALGQITTKESWKYLGVTYDCTLYLTKYRETKLKSVPTYPSDEKYALFSLKISNSQFTSILSQAILPKLFYNAAVWGHKAFTKSNLQKITTNLSTDKHPTNQNSSGKRNSY